MPSVTAFLLLAGTLALSPIVVAQQGPCTEGGQSGGQQGDQQGRTPLPVEMTAEEQQKMGIGVSTLVDVTQPVVEDVYATVVDVSALAALADELVITRAAASASRNEADRLIRLAQQDQSASRQATEAAGAIAIADETRADLAKRRLGLEWGPVFVKMSLPDVRQLLDEITQGDAALVRIDGARGCETLSKHGQLSDPGGVGLVSLSMLGVAAMTDPRFQGIGLLALARGPAAVNLRPGRVFAATIEERTETTGVVLARSALVRLDGSVWAYVQLRDGHFERRQVVDGRQIESGWFVTRGFNAGEHLVTEGAGSLVALERLSETEAVE